MEEERKDKIARKLNIDLDFPGDNFTKIRKFVDEVIEECRLKITDRLVDNILEVVLEDMDCIHTVEHDEDGSHTFAEYNLKYELKVRNKIIAILKPPEKEGE